MTDDRERYGSSELESTADAQSSDSPGGPETGTTDPYPDPDTAQTVFKQTIASSFALVIIHLLLALLFDCLRWVNLLLALYHLGFGIYVFRRLRQRGAGKATARSVLILLLVAITATSYVPTVLGAQQPAELGTASGQVSTIEASLATWFSQIWAAVKTPVHMVTSESDADEGDGSSDDGNIDFDPDYPRLQSPVGPDQEPTDPDRHIDT